ncbi:DUF4347 domain-containing protein, partial [Azospirillum sp. TSO22-1]|uniref:DUF4347 domain-containing protein n=1 Tax=Azospirillum sp. TSO22-1 TaxID=716789 RepID=UPI000D64359D
MSFPARANTDTDTPHGIAAVPDREILLADAGLPDLDTLLRTRRARVEVRLVAGEEDGLAALESAFAVRPAAVHVLAHGEPGRIGLGRGGIDRERVAGAALTGGGAGLLLYGCATGAGAAGRAFVDALAARTGGAVAAASRPVGDAGQGGGWDLDVTAGVPAARSAFGAGREGWRHLLAVYTGTGGDDTLIGGIGENDTLIGGDGLDIAVYAGNQADYDLTQPGLVVAIATGETDTLSGIDQLVFDDGTVVLNTAPGAVGDDDATPDTVAENAATGTAVGITALAADAEGNTVTYSLSDDAGGRFAIDATTGVVTVADGSLLDYESATSHTIVVAASDGSQTTTQAMTIDLTNAVEPQSWYGTGGDDVFAAPSDDTWMIDGGDGNDTLAGAALADTLIGGNGNDVLAGGDGDDLFLYGMESDGYDAVDGGAGADTIASASDWTAIRVGSVDGVEEITADGHTGVTIAADAADNTLNFSAVTLTGIGQIDGGDGNDTITGSAAADHILGGSGADSLLGGTGDDTLDGGAGVDTLAGGTGNDTYLVDAAGDTVTEALAAGTDTVRTTLNSYSLGSNVENLAFDGTGAFTGTGNTLNNLITGGTGNDTLTGGLGNDTLDGGDGIDTASYATSSTAVGVNLATGVHAGGAAGDTLTNIEVVAGSNFNDTLTGDSGGNWFQAGAGNDTLTGGAGGDTLDGGSGTDTASYAGSASGVVVDLAAGTGALGDAAGDTLTGIENVTGSAYDDTLTGDAGANLLVGGAGNDSLNGGLGNDTLTGGLGNDTYVVDSAGDVINENTGEGTDTVRTTLASYTLGAPLENLTYTGTGAFTGTGNAANNVITGGTGADSLTGGLGNDTLAGGVGNDTLDGGSGNDSMTGGIGNDVFIVDSASDAVVENLNEGTDTVRTSLASYTLGNNVETLAYTGSGSFSGVGNTLNNLIQGGAGNDTLRGGTGADTLDGGGGFDTASYTTAVGINLATGVHSGEALGDQLLNIEVIATSAFNDTLTGDAGGNWFQAGAGNDWLDGGAGSDTLDGGDGIDTASYAGAAGPVSVDLAAGMASVDGDIDTLIGIENVTGSAYDDTLAGDAGVNVLTGRAGNDTYIVDSSADTVVEQADEGYDTVHVAASAYSLGDHVEALVYDGSDGFAGTGNDLANLIQGGAGNDTLTGGGGADTLAGGDGFDVASYETSSSGITVNLTTGVNTGDADGDVLDGIEAVAGTAYGDSFVGDANANWFIGGAGDDTLEGGDGADTLDGGDGFDSLGFGASGSGVYIDLAGGVTGDGDTLISIENVAGSSYADTLVGDAGANSLGGGGGTDWLEGGDGDDTLSGGSGADTLSGGSGIDVLIGGADNDTYLVDSPEDLIVENNGEGADLVRTTSLTYALGNHVEYLAYDGSGNFTGVGNTLANRLEGGSGDDTLIGGVGADTLIGGAGTDVASYETSSTGITVNLVSGVHTGDAMNDVFNGIEIIAGSNYADNFTGGIGNDWFRGGAGNDTLIGGAGADVLEGGDGIDYTTYIDSTAGVTVNLGTGWGSGGHAQNDSITGIENVTGSNYADVLIGDLEANVLEGGNGNDTLTGGTGDDTLIGGAGADSMDGGGGFDVVSYAGSSTALTINMATGVHNNEALGDTFANIEKIIGSNYNDNITGDGGDNWLVGGGGADTLNGGAGNDTLEGSGAATGTDSLIGGTGNDVYILASAAVVTEAASGGIDEVRTSLASYNLVNDVENLTYTGTGSFSGTGNSLANVITGGAGNDTLTGGGGVDTLIGGDGIDTAMFLGQVTINLATGVHTGEAANEQFFGIEIYATAATATTSSTFIGDAQANWFRGGGGNDTLTGGAGADTLDGGGATNWANYSTSSAGVSINLGAGTASGGDAEGDVLLNIEYVMGSNFDDVLIGFNGQNGLYGGAGNDTL